jgi:hypothetical protein
LAIHRFRQGKNASGKRDDFQLSLGAMAIFESENCGRNVRQIQSGSATFMIRTVDAKTTSIRLGEGVHRMSILFVSSNEEVTEGHGKVSLPQNGRRTSDLGPQRDGQRTSGRTSASHLAVGGRLRFGRSPGAEV